MAVDIDIREHNRMAIEAHHMSSRIEMIQGSSLDPNIVQQIQDIAGNYQKVMVLLDSNHTHQHVLSELEFYAPLTSVDSYCIVFDTLVEDMPPDAYPDRSWGPGDNPKTAVLEYLKTHTEFQVDELIENKILISSCPNGYLKRIE